MHVESAAPSPRDHERVDPRTIGTLLADSTVIALAATQRGRIVFANPAFLAMFHAADALTGHPLANLVTDVDSGRLAQALVTAEHTPVRYFGIGRRDGAPLFDLEMSLERTMHDGEPPLSRSPGMSPSSIMPRSSSPISPIPIVSPDWRTAPCSPIVYISPCAAREATAQVSPC